MSKVRIKKNHKKSTIEYFKKLQFNDDWSFKGLTQKHTNYITHGYHRYPAKFIPQLAAKLISELSKPGDLVVDPFMGSSTTLTEVKKKFYVPKSNQFKVE
jgi:DNA modification methylase